MFGTKKKLLAENQALKEENQRLRNELIHAEEINEAIWGRAIWGRTFFGSWTSHLGTYIFWLINQIISSAYNNNKSFRR